LPQNAQLNESVSKLASQPLPTSLSQLSKVVLHVWTVHAALMQLTVPFAIAAQGLLQPPQLFTSGATVG